MTDTLNINDVEIYYRETGQGRPVLFIPGWLYPTELFARNLPVIGEQYRALAYDPRSHGRSGITAAGNNYGQHGRDLHEIIGQLDLTDVILVGWSLGVTIIYSYIEQFDVDKVAAFISVDESPGLVKRHEQDWGEGSAKELSELVETISNYGHLDFYRQYFNQGFDHEVDADLARCCAKYAGKLPAETAGLLLADAMLRDYRELAKQIDQRIPVLHIVRESWRDQALAWIKTNQPNAEVNILGGHHQLFEYAEQFNQLLLRFLDGLTTKPTLKKNNALIG